jgi:hypothetical protein
MIFILFQFFGTWKKKIREQAKFCPLPLIFDVKKPRHLDYWQNQPVDVFLVIRDDTGTIRWMNITRCLKVVRNFRLSPIFIHQFSQFSSIFSS